MSSNNGVIRIGRKGTKKFAFREDGEVFEVDVVAAFHDWMTIDDMFREDDRTIKTDRMSEYHKAAQTFAEGFDKNLKDITTTEALEFLELLRQQYEELANFFQPKLRTKPDSPATSEQAMRFSVEDS